jgi:hypothetical protein
MSGGVPVWFGVGEEHAASIWWYARSSSDASAAAARRSSTDAQMEGTEARPDMEIEHVRSPPSS